MFKIPRKKGKVYDFDMVSHELCDIHEAFQYLRKRFEGPWYVNQMVSRKCFFLDSQICMGIFHHHWRKKTKKYSISGWKIGQSKGKMIFSSVLGVQTLYNLQSRILSIPIINKNFDSIKYSSLFFHGLDVAYHKIRSSQIRIF